MLSVYIIQQRSVEGGPPKNAHTPSSRASPRPSAWSLQPEPTTRRRNLKDSGANGQLPAYDTLKVEKFSATPYPIHPRGGDHPEERT